jgi:hypothetical protein
LVSQERSIVLLDHDCHSFDSGHSEWFRTARMSHTSLIAEVSVWVTFLPSYIKVRDDCDLTDRQQEPIELSDNQSRDVLIYAFNIYSIPLALLPLPT